MGRSGVGVRGWARAQASWFETPVAVSGGAATLPAPFPTLLANSTLFPQFDQLGPALYAAYDPAQAPYVTYFGGHDAGAFVCMPAPRATLGPIVCSSANAPDALAPPAPDQVWMTVMDVSVSSSLVNATIIFNSTTPASAVNSGAVALAASRLDYQAAFAAQVASIQTSNTARRDSARAYVVALFLLLAWAMLWHVILAADLFGWVVPFFRLDAQATFAVWFSIFFMIQLILTLTVGLLGWAIGGILFALIEIAAICVFITVRYRDGWKPAERDAERAHAKGDQDHHELVDVTAPASLAEVQSDLASYVREELWEGGNRGGGRAAAWTASLCSRHGLLCALPSTRADRVFDASPSVPRRSQQGLNMAVKPVPRRSWLLRPWRLGKSQIVLAILSAIFIVVRASLRLRSRLRRARGTSGVANVEARHSGHGTTRCGGAAAG